MSSITVRAALAVALLGIVMEPLGAQVRTAPGERPNIVLIITDDVGYGDIGSFGAADVRTPHIDRLARDGVRLTDFYAMPQCTPTRAALITGRYPQRVALERALSTLGPTAELGLTPRGYSLPALLRNAGYATALIGKWHLGLKPEFSPNAHGFEHFYGFLSGYVDFYTHTRGGDGAPDLWENGVAVTDSGYMTDLITERAIGFIDRSAARPFFLEVAYSAAHWPFQPPGRPSRAPNNAAFEQPSDSIVPTRADYVAMLEHADAGIGRILQSLERHGLTRNTLVIFTNDNGGEWLSSNAPFFHRKDTLWEGGIRVPAIFRWPARLPRGASSSVAGITMDLAATILSAADVRLPDEPALEGRDLLPVLTGGSQDDERALFWRIATTGRQQRAVRRGPWKLLRDGDDLLLFDLSTDPGERHDLAAARPAIVRSLVGLLRSWEADVDAEAARLTATRGR